MVTRNNTRGPTISKTTRTSSSYFGLEFRRARHPKVKRHMRLVLSHIKKDIASRILPVPSLRALHSSMFSLFVYNSQLRPRSLYRTFPPCIFCLPRASHRRFLIELIWPCSRSRCFSHQQQNHHINNLYSSYDCADVLQYSSSWFGQAQQYAAIIWTLVHTLPTLSKQNSTHRSKRSKTAHQLHGLKHFHLCLCLHDRELH